MTDIERQILTNQLYIMTRLLVPIDFTKWEMELRDNIEKTQQILLTDFWNKLDSTTE